MSSPQEKSICEKNVEAVELACAVEAIEVACAVEEVAAAEALEFVNHDMAFDEKVPEYLTEMFDNPPVYEFSEKPCCDDEKPGCEDEKAALAYGEGDLEKQLLLQADIEMQNYAPFDEPVRTRNSTSKATVVVYLVMAACMLGMVVYPLVGGNAISAGLAKGYATTQASLSTLKGSAMSSMGCKGAKGA